MDDCAEGMRKFTTEIFDTGVALVGYVVMLFVYDWRLALFCMIFTPVSYVCAELMKKPVQRAARPIKRRPRRSARRRSTGEKRRHLPRIRLRGCAGSAV